MEINKKPWPLSTAFKLKSRIDTNPDYQRPAVWSTAQKQLLIQSIIQGYDIPKLYWRLVAKNPDKYEVVDGQQRLRAIWEFMENKYALPKDCDPIDGHKIAGKKYSELDDDVVISFDQYCLDVAVLVTADEDEVREMFLRLQNGTTLKAQEKRNAFPGKMRDFVCALSKHKFFNSVNFSNSRFLYDHIAAQMMLITHEGQITNIKDRDLNILYKKGVDFDTNSEEAKKVTRVLNYLYAMFPKKIPELKRFNVVSLFILIASLMDGYVIKGRESEIADWFIDFEKRRDEDKEKAPEERDPILLQYHEHTAHTTDASNSLKFRDEVLREDLFTHVPDIKTKDPKRMFDETQRRVIYRKFDGCCQICHKKCDWDNYHADHIVPWANGGTTTVANGQLLCPECNLKKGAK